MTVLLDKIIDAVADPIFVKDQRHRWVVFNKAFCEFMGHTREELLGKSDFEFFPRVEAETFWAKDVEVFDSGEVNINEEPFTDADGERHIIVTKKSVFIAPGGEKFLVGIIRDVTELKWAEEDLRRSRDELELRVEERTREVEEAQEHLRQAEKMGLLGQLAGGIAHDFNNLLGGILGSADLMAHGPCSEEDRAKYVSTILETGHAAADLVRQLLAFARPEPMHRVAFDLHDLIEDVIRVLERTIDPRIRIRRRFALQRAVVDGDRSELHSAVLNLAVNARDAMPEGGNLTFSTAEVALDAGACRQYGHALEPGSYIELGVTDDGVGMAAEVLARIFEPFFTTKEVGRGTGLGLAAVYGTVHGHGGALYVYSEPGHGTVFKLHLPRAAGDLRPEGIPSPESVRGSGTILLVDDEAVIRNLTREMLRALGYEVLLAADGAEALATHAERRAEIDLVILDLVMPGMNGSEVLRKLRRAEPEVRVLVASGFHLDVDMSEIRTEGAQGFIAKPYISATLSHAVASALHDPNNVQSRRSGK